MSFIVDSTMGMRMVPRGALIVLEGLDHSGKTTQAKMIVSSLMKRGVSVEPLAWRFPDRETPIGKMISAYLTNATAMDDHALHLLFSANRWEKADRLRGLLAAGKTVIIDRYVYSGVAYTAAKGYDIPWCKECDRGLPAPDAVLFVTIPHDIASSRGTYGSEKYETRKMQESVRRIYETIGGGPRWHSIDGVGAIEEVHQRCMEIVDKTIERMEPELPLDTLW